MKISPFAYMFKTDQFGFLVYNSITNSFAKINDPLYKLLNDSRNDPNLLNNIDTDTYISLTKAQIIIKDNDVKNYIYQKKFLRNLHTYQDNTLNLTIAPTSACNFSCPYCYEKGINPKTMTDEVIEKLITFISKSTSKQIAITWYGGEPLLAIDKIEKILNRINSIEEKKIIHQHIVTNGYYLNEKNIEFITHNHLKSIQVTLDGATPEFHNQRRFTKEGMGSWNMILNNLDNLLLKNTEISVSLRCNIDVKNKNNFETLRTNLLKRWNNNPRVNIYPAILINHNKAGDTDCIYMSSIESTNYLIEEGIKSNDLNYFNFMNEGCGATQLNSYVVGPEGELYKCWNDMGRKDKIIRFIHNDTILNKELLFQFTSGPSMFEDEECLKCPLFFVCNGGCQWMRLKNEFDNDNQNYCHIAKNDIEKYLESYYKNKLNQNLDKEN